jgi:hypothetical protein
MAKNCHTCDHLSYFCGDYGEQSGYSCEKRDPKTVAEESKLLKNLDSEEYSNRYKRCFESKGAA